MRPGSERKWRVYGTTAIETWRQARGAQVTRLTQVWVLRDAQWQVATVHLSNFAKP